ncbi:SMI1/KNR4 family protein [Photobacterium halotolerans]|uniref:SMI1/KNR4 family protein n=1 Tax=Photobacterium halotolerans TaxID=265726 RepID=UPI000483DE50|nr:SMI1/KNR4 family protein [Photobacterium halotolerans]
MLDFFDASEKVSDDAIKVLESFIGASLPEDYYVFLSSKGGGYPQPDCFRFMNEDEGSSIQRFYGLNRSDDYDLVRKLKTYSNRIPSESIPVACDPGGNQICLMIRGKNRGKIYFLDHEFESEYDPAIPNEFNMKLISNSFTEFINGFYDLEV